MSIRRQNAGTASRYVGRFAPSPTGPLHAGSLVAALGSWLLARRHHGQWSIRIEDLDPPREVAGAADAELRMLAACGLTSDTPLLYQGTRGARYQHALDRLLASGDAFVCHCSRSDLAANAGIHRGPCVSTRPRLDPAVRLHVPFGTRIAFDDGIQGHIEEDVAADVGDFVLRRADGPWAYQLAVVVDDAAQGMTDIVRGADLLGSTARQILLQQRLGVATPRYTHLPMIVDAAGDKLSKSRQALPLDPANPLPALRAAWRALGQRDEVIPTSASVTAFTQAACDAFDPARIPKGPVVIVATHNTADIVDD